MSLFRLNQEFGLFYESSLQPFGYLAVYLELEDADNAEKAIEGAEAAIQAFRMALVYYDMGKKEKALEHLKRAMFVWEEADPEFKPAKKARETLAEWESS